MSTPNAPKTGTPPPLPKKTISIVGGVQPVAGASTPSTSTPNEDKNQSTSNANSGENKSGPARNPPAPPKKAPTPAPALPGSPNNPPASKDASQNQNSSADVSYFFLPLSLLY